MYHAILGRSAYAKFMAVPNYMYLKLKIPGPKGIIIVGQHISAHTSATLNAFNLLKQLSGSRGSTPSLDPRTRMSLSRLSVLPALSSPPRTSRMRSSPTMVVHSVSGRRSILNRKARSLTSSKRTSMCLHGNPPT
jgi:hypothetical protein